MQPTEPPAASLAPTATPVTAPPPTEVPQPTEAPTSAPEPTTVPTQAPTATTEPTAVPTEAPTPTAAPTDPPSPVPTEAPVQAAAVTFSKDIQPLIERRCINCHGGKDGIKGGLSMKTHADLMKGGESGAVIIAGDPANSLLVQLIVKGEMPKRAPKLPQAEIDLISAWVAAGAKND
ncbi:MAG: hypothetical protein N2204_00010 [Anaerolineae bacterium]|nr:hypothetical protein [Anaerolineae bacterium]